MPENKIKEAQEAFIDQITSTHVFKTYEDTNKIMVYDNQEGIYRPAESTITEQCCISTLVNTPQSKNMIEMNIRGRTYTTRRKYNDAVCVGNGVILFENGGIKHIPHTYKLIFESKLNINYDSTAKCPVWIDTLAYILPKQCDRDLLQEWFGYHFIFGNPYEKAMFLTGKRSTGKSTTIWVIDTLMGGCCSHWQLSDLTQDKNYSNADLYGKLANTYTDMGNSTISDCGRFKVLTGSRDTLTARMPYQVPFNFVNCAKLTFASNRLPPLSAAVQGDMAFWKRVLLLQFQITVDKVDIEIFDKLNAEMSGILNWALDGYIRLKTNHGQFTRNTDDVYSTWNSSAYTINPLDDFITESMIRSNDIFIPLNLFKIGYEKWCALNKEPILSGQELRAYLSQKGIFEATKMNKDTGNREIILKGICEA
jgi:putative DNA primase/helicase